MTPIEIEADSWESGCEFDDVRNHFVIPELTSYLQAGGIRRIADIGCGTGYISRALTNIRIADGPAEWLLLDRDPRILEFARDRFPAVRAEFVAADLQRFLGSWRSAPYDLAFCAYTLLEVVQLEAFADSLKLLVPGGYIVLFVPDPLDDILRHHEQYQFPLDNLLLREDHHLVKLDPFTNRQQTFIARQVIRYVEVFIDESTSLSAVSSYRSRGGTRHYMLSFSRYAI
ncbi:class I SAM-dependent methyltransferase [Mycobacterium hackensackense]|uniref:class I SAM-dependent methyltransferase n=1 Tax=Mycobacterium hackensackense TaxID=228909 RepID=UPI002265EE88|nr:class I SAM-dependent methyltransferase [Mycobacterium hackensackense]MCV7252296.1 class I SAM-dependent methyltransferase [Mycobacterium hackensackense]